MNHTFPLFDTARPHAEAALKATAQAQEAVLDSGKAIFDLQFQAVRDHTTAVLGLFGTVARAEPTEAWRLLAEKGPEFARATAERASRFAADQWAVAQKAAESLQAAARPLAAA